MYSTLDSWMEHEVIPCFVDSTERFNTSIEKVVDAIGDEVEVLGLGEGLHGGEDILQFRNRLFQRLVEAHDFSAIAIESSFPRGRVVNDYVLGNDVLSYEDVQEPGFSHGFGQLEANRELVEWMRRYNAESSHRTRVRFYGFDSPTEMYGTDSPRQTLHFVLDYLASMGGGRVRQRRERIDSLIGADADWEKFDALMDPAKSVGRSEAASALRIETEDLISELKIRRPDLVVSGGEERFSEALYYAVVARQLLNYHAEMAVESAERVANLLGIRDTMMVENLDYIVSRERARGKVLVFAHNRHLQRSRISWELGGQLHTWWPAGAHLEVLYGSRYVVIGTGLGVSEANGIGQPEPGTLEAWLTGRPGPVRFIPTHRGHGLPEADRSSLPTRSGSLKNSTYMPLDARSIIDFDWLAVLDTTTYTRGGPPLP